MHALLFAALLLGTGPAADPSAVAGASPDSLPSCHALLDGLARTLEADYAGFALEIRGSAREKYDRHLGELRARAQRTTGDECYFVLSAYTDQFHDPHVFLFQSTYLDSAEVARRAARPGYVQRSVTSEQLAQLYFARHAGHLDPLEGIWRDGALRVAIIPGTSDSRRHFLAVVLTADSSTWKALDVRARFDRRPDGTYSGVLLERNLAKRYTVATIYKRALLRFDPGMWAKESPVLRADSGLVSLTDPHLATLTWRGATPVLSIPSNDPSYRDTLYAIVASHHAALVAAPRLIIDLRGNEGGSSWVTDTVLPLVMSAAKRVSTAPPGDAQMLSSPDNIEYVKQRSDNISSDTASIARLMARLAAHPGALVPLQDSIDRARELAQPAPVASSTAEPPGSARVGILIDGGTVSAAEVFLLAARLSTRVTVFGEPTAGALDYESVQIVRIGDSAHRWYLGVPTIAARPDLPKGGMKGIGIPPDVRVTWARVPDPIGYVDEALARTP